MWRFVGPLKCIHTVSGYAFLDFLVWVKNADDNDDYDEPGQSYVTTTISKPM